MKQDSQRENPRFSTSSFSDTNDKKQSTSSEVLCFLCLCPQDTTSFCGETANIIWPTGQHHCPLADAKRCGFANDVMLYINDVATLSQMSGIEARRLLVGLRLPQPKMRTRWPQWLLGFLSHFFKWNRVYILRPKRLSGRTWTKKYCKRNVIFI